MERESGRRRPTGRRTGDSGTRDAILDAARDLFAEHGYDGASMRAIAAAAGVDPALIRHFFGDKERLFVATVAARTVIPERLAQAFAGDRSSAGSRLTDAYLRLWEDPDTRPVLLSLVRSALTSGRAADMLMEVLAPRLRAEGRLDAHGEGALRRTALAASHLFGTAVARYVITLPWIADLSREDLVAALAPTIQRYLDGEERPRS